MTTNAPERIWTHSCAPTDEGGVWLPWETDGTEFIRADLAPSPEVVKELVEALRAVVAALHDAEKTLTEELHYMDFCGESLPLCKARAALEKLEGGE